MSGVGLEPTCATANLTIEWYLMVEKGK